MPRSHRRRSSRRFVYAGVVGALVVVAGAAWYYWPHAKPASARPGPAVAAKDLTPPAPAKREEVKSPPKPAEPEYKLVADEQVLVPATSSRPASQPSDSAFRFKSGAAPQPDDPPQESTQRDPGERLGPAQDPTASRATSDSHTGHRRIEAARRLLDSGQLLDARQALNALLGPELGESESTEVRALLTRIADDTVFGRQSAAGDPLVDTYLVQSGDVLINIAKKYDVPHEALMLVNGITNAAALRAEQKLKVVRGPFHAKIYKSKFRLDVYLQNLYIRSFRVGLGSENGTPEGVWKVKNRLSNPTYFPPASAPNKHVIAPDDPHNPLGEHWLGLEGVGGPAVGHAGYGIHGTIEPESIGKAVSLGCVRMHNEDVALLYKLLSPGRSTVTIFP